MTMQREMMTDAEIRDQLRRADRFRDELRAAISETVVDRENNCADAQRRALARIAGTLDAVPLIVFANLANVDLALTRRTGCGLMPIIEVHLLAVGTGPTLDHLDAAAFLTPFTDIVEKVRARKIN